MKILVGGGSGFIGQHLKKLIESQGHQMIVISRKSRGPRDLTWTGLERDGLPNGVDSVVNLSGVNIMSPVRWTDQFKKELIDSRVQTTLQLSRAVTASQHKPSSFIAISAIGYYGADDNGEEVTEDSPAGGDFSAKLCQQWEAAAEVDEAAVRKVTVRIGLALGRSGGMVTSMYWPFFFGVGGNIGDGKQWFPWVHADDVAGIILHAIKDSTVTGVLNAVAPHSTTNDDFTTTFSREMWRFAPFPVPKFVLSMLLGEERAKMLTSSPLIKPTRTMQSGYQFKYADLKSACADCVRWR